MSGRVDIKEHNPQVPFVMFSEDKNAVIFSSREGEAIRSVHSKNPVSSLFFSRKNVDVLQDGIRYGVYKATNGTYVISRQSDTELQIIMREVYMQHGKFIPYNVIDQVRDLNAHVLDFCIPRIVQEINMYQKYKHDIGTPRHIIDRGEFVSSKGSRVNELKRFM